MSKQNKLFFIIFIIFFLFVISCAPKEVIKTAKVQEPSVSEDYQKPLPSISQSKGLGNLCSGEEECISFCLNNRGRCEQYCKANENELCTKIFPPGQETYQEHQEECSGKGTVNFTSPPMNIEEIEMILPIGLMIGWHVTPIDHGYYTAVGWKPEYKGDKTKYKNVLSPADGVIRNIGHMPRAKEGEDYRLVIYHTCTFYTIYIHVWELSPKLLQALGGSPYKSRRSFRKVRRL